MGPRYATPEDAARGDIPLRYCRALDVVYSPDGRHAVVLLGTNEHPYVYPYQVVCSWGDRGWIGGTGGNGPGRTCVTDGMWVETEWIDRDDEYALEVEWRREGP